MQAHEEFKEFVGTTDEIVGITPIFNELENWVEENNVAAKSLGIGFVGENGVIVTLGFRRDQEPTTVKVVLVRLLAEDENDDLETEIIEEALKEASAGLAVICHDLLSDSHLSDSHLSGVFLCEA